MSTHSGTTSRLPNHPSTGDAGAPAVDGDSWLDALGALVAARAELLRYESKGLARHWVRTVALLVVAALAMAFAWLLLLAGGVAILAATTGWPWYWLAIGTAALHLIAACICLMLAKSAPPPAFPLSRTEFSKDRQWLQSLTTRRK